MRIFCSARAYDAGQSALALGTFDGVHLGHQALIERAKSIARSEGLACVVCTFDRHPLELLKPERAPRMLLTLDERIQKLERLGVDAVLVQPFTAEFAAMEAEAYLQSLAQLLHARAIVAGFNYSFGARGRGDADMIRAFAAPLGYRAEIVGEVIDGTDCVSSTLIRKLLERGERERAERLMRLNGM